MRYFLSIIITAAFIFMNMTWSNQAEAQSFSANWVDIHHLERGVYRITIRYTHLEIGEYHEAYVDYVSKQQAIDVFTKLALGANFYWGVDGKIQFATASQTTTLNPY